MSCATKSRAREKRPGPPPLRSEEFPRGLVGLDSVNQDRVDADNFSSDFLLALQHWGHRQNIACLRENPLRSLHWWDPIEQFVYQEGEWFDLDYDACVFGGARRKAQKFRHNIPWRSSRSGQFSTFNEAEYTPSLVFTLAVCCAAWAARQGYGILAIPRLPPIPPGTSDRFFTSTLRTTRRPDDRYGLPPRPFAPLGRLLVCPNTPGCRGCLSESFTSHGRGRVHWPWPLFTPLGTDTMAEPIQAGEGRAALDSVRVSLDHLTDNFLAWTPHDRRPLG